MSRLVLKAIVLNFIISCSVFAKDREILCHYDGNGYDDELISAKVSHEGNISSLVYESYQGEVGPFLNNDRNIFKFSEESLIIEETISFSNSLKSAVLITSYKQGGIHSIQHFDCLQ